MIELKDLHKVIDGAPSIDIPVLEVAVGKIAALVGPAGSGIEALMDLFSGKTRPSAGRVRLAGWDPHQEKNETSRSVGVMFAEDAVYMHLSPEANLEFQARLYGLPKKRVMDVLALVGLADQARANPTRLSSSLLRRLAFGRVILHHPQVLILHEPFNRCDSLTIGLISSLLREMSQQGTAILIIADDPANLDGLCEPIYILDQGKIVGTRNPPEAQSSQYPIKIPARLEDKTVVLLNPSEILYCYAAEGRAHLVTEEGKLPTQFTLAELEERLLRRGFFRAHRGFLVNLQHVKEVIPFTRNSFSLRLDDTAGTEIPLSKAAAAELSDLLGY